MIPIEYHQNRSIELISFEMDENNDKHLVLWLICSGATLVIWNYSEMISNSCFNLMQIYPA